MSKNQKIQTIVLAVVMVICVVLTAVLLTNSIQCTDCRKNFTGKYYISISGRPYCKDCGAEYYRGFPGDLDNVTGRVNNNLRNVAITVELIGFVGAMIVINKNKHENATHKIPPVTPIISRVVEPVIKNGTTKTVEPVIKKEYPTEPVTIAKPEVKVVTTPKVEKAVDANENPATTVAGGGLKTTFKPKTAENETDSSEESKSDWFKPAGEL